MIIQILIGFFSGIISGMGIGGGTILIPALTIFLDINQKSAQAINLIYFIPTAIISIITHKKNNRIEKNILKPLIIWGVLGSIAGSFLMNFLSPATLKTFFGYFLLFLGTLEIIKGIKQKSS